MKNESEIREELKQTSMKLSEMEEEQRVIRAALECTQDERGEMKGWLFGNAVSKNSTDT